MDHIRVSVGSLDRGPVARLAESAGSAGLLTEKSKESCTGPAHPRFGEIRDLAAEHRGKTLYRLVIEGDPNVVARVMQLDPGLRFSPGSRHGVHDTGRRWWGT